jgi:acetyl esterase/lipase
MSRAIGAAAHVLLVGCGWSFLWASARAEVPPAPPGYSSEEEVRSALLAGKLTIIDTTITVPVTIEVEKDIEYGKGGDVELKLDLYRPKKRDNRLPAVVFIHGGAWRGGSREMYHYYCVKFAERGYAAATISYRLLRVAPFPAAVQDAKCAVRWMRANAAKLGVDPNRIGVAGGSAGGHLSMMVAYATDIPELEGNGGYADTSSRVQAIVNIYGPTDLTTEEARTDDTVSKFLGAAFDVAPDRYQLASPITHVSQDDPPTLILHGSIDSTVPIEHAEMLVDGLKKAGLEYDYDRVEGWPHAMDLESNVNRHCLAKMFEFFDKHLAAGDEPAAAAE